MEYRIVVGNGEGEGRYPAIEDLEGEVNQLLQEAGNRWEGSRFTGIDRSRR